VRESRRGGKEDRGWVNGGKNVTWGLIFAGEAAEPGAIGEASVDVDVTEPQYRWGALHVGDRGRCRCFDITCGRL
jgi:hypothetical protein